MILRWQNRGGINALALAIGFEFLLRDSSGKVEFFFQIKFLLHLLECEVMIAIIDTGLGAR